MIDIVSSWSEKHSSNVTHDRILLPKFSQNLIYIFFFFLLFGNEITCFTTEYMKQANNLMLKASLLSQASYLKPRSVDRRR